ncbi:hypothetical protein L1887_38272 [Cichorium endivia]|nr:hypothetical protein L1887_38272 [Cichorium endivia]
MNPKPRLPAPTGLAVATRQPPFAKRIKSPIFSKRHNLTDSDLLDRLLLTITIIELHRFAKWAFRLCYLG